MQNYAEKVGSFLSLKRIAVAGVSRNPKTEVGNAILEKFVECGYEVFPVNPHAEEIDGLKCFPEVKSIPGGVEGVFAATKPEITLQIAKDCAEAGIKHLWLHSTMGKGSYFKETEKFCEENRIEIIPRGCPMLHLKPVDGGHKFFHFILRRFRKI